ncbi:hypothetical protein GA0115246_111156 [Streptomyces sp. SolWspMP-sol7th]|nr:hypothetical protein GA0115246_111156 [Streptomyces sp. SolWspMP-sol7th]
MERHCPGAKHSPAPKGVTDSTGAPHHRKHLRHPHRRRALGEYGPCLPRRRAIGVLLAGRALLGVRGFVVLFHARSVCELFPHHRRAALSGRKYSRTRCSAHSRATSVGSAAEA